MAFEPNYEKVVSSQIIKGGTTQATVEARLPKAEDGEVLKVLTANAQAYLVSSDINTNEVDYNGVVGISVIYSTPEGGVGNMYYTTNFSDKYLLNQQYEQATPMVGMQVVDVKASLVGGEVKVVVVVESTIDLIVTTNTQALVGFGNNDVFTKSSSVIYSTFNGLVVEKQEHTQTMQLHDNVASVVGACISSSIKKVTPYNNYAKVEALLNFDVTYKHASGELKTTHYTQDIELDATLEGINQNSRLLSDIMVAVDDVRLTTDLDGDNTTLTAIVPTIYRGYVFNDVELEVIDDLFSTTNYLTVSTFSVPSASDINSKYCTEKLDGGLTISESDPFIDELIGATCGRVVVSNTGWTDDRLFVEGLCYVNVLYLNKELNNINSVSVQIPFSVDLDGNYNNDVYNKVNVAVTDIAARCRRGKEIDVNALLQIYVGTSDEDTLAVITDVKLDDEIPQSECALSIVVAQDGDTLWDIAKKENVSPDMLMEQNENLSLPLVSGSRVVVYRQHIANFD